MARAAARLEESGIPTVMVTRQGFEAVNINGFISLGFRGGASQVIFPTEMFVPGVALTPVEQNIDKIVWGLTKWQPTADKRVVVKPAKVIVQGKDYGEALTNMNKLFLRNLWGDGLPILPPTEERVKWLLTGTEFPRDKVICKMLPRGGIVTVESLAVALAMAGGRPEYMPVLMAGIEAIADPKFQHERMQATTCSSYPLVIVNGPVAKQIRLSSGYGCLGPDPLHPAGASIGRAIRLLLLDMGGAIPGSGSMSLYGGPARYTGLVVAEDEDGLPPNWKPLSVERGFPQGSNIVTVDAVSSTTNVERGEAESAEKQALVNLDAWAEYLGVTTGVYYSGAFNPNGIPGVLLITPATARIMSDAGWPKEKVQTFLWENTKRPKTELLKTLLKKEVEKAYLSEEYVQFPMPIAYSPKNIMIVVAGGDNFSHSYWLQSANTYRPTSGEVKLPAEPKWDELLKQAEKDLGPIPLRSLTK